MSALTGLPPNELDRVTGSILADLVLWRGDFAVQPPPGSPPRNAPSTLLNDAERSHMRDVRTVFTAFWLLVAAGVAGLAVAARRTRGDTSARAAALRAASMGARALAVVIAVAGVFAIVAFDAAFELFHRLLFSGNYTFDPATDKLVQLFPEAFWSDIAIAVGAVVIVMAIVVSWWAARRAAAIVRPVAA